MLGSVLGIMNKMKNKKDKYEAYDLGREMIRDNHQQKGVRWPRNAVEEEKKGMGEGWRESPGQSLEGHSGAWISVQTFFDLRWGYSPINPSYVENIISWTVI